MHIYTDALRPLNLDLGPDGPPFWVQSTEIYEALSRPFHIKLRLWSRDADLEPAELLGRPGTLYLDLEQPPRRPFHGQLQRLHKGVAVPTGWIPWEAHLEPWTHQLTLGRDCRIFQDRSVQQILTRLFQEAGCEAFEFRTLSRGQTPRPYCAQYLESPWAFINRLLEEEGITYFYEHEAERHTLVMVDDLTALSPAPPVPWLGSEGADLDVDGVLALELGQVQTPTRVALGDYDWQHPEHPLMVSLETGPGPERYGYPGVYTRLRDGETQARIELERHLGEARRLRGHSTCRVLQTGGRHPFEPALDRPPFAAPFVPLEIHHEAHQPAPFEDGEAPLSYRNRFAALPWPSPWCPPRRAPRPAPRGPHSAQVVGPEGQEIWCDAQGRIKVRFHWDRRSAPGGESTCWLRVAQAWAGEGWGAFCLPRVGQEVLVDFLDGDVDRPVVTGALHNGSHRPPVALPDQATRSVWRSRSSPGGGGYNELSFEDRAGAEAVYLRAQRDLHREVLGDLQGEVGGDEQLSIGGDRELQVGGDARTQVEGDRRTAITGDERRRVGGDRHLETRGDHVHLTRGDHHLRIQRGDRQVALEAGDHRTALARGDHVLHLSQGDCLRRIDGGSWLVQSHRDSGVDVAAGDLYLGATQGGIGIEAPRGALHLDAETVSGRAAEALTLRSQGELHLSAARKITLQVGEVSLVLDTGSITLNAPRIASKAIGLHEIIGALIKLN